MFGIFRRFFETEPAEVLVTHRPDIEPAVGAAGVWMLEEQLASSADDDEDDDDDGMELISSGDDIFSDMHQVSSGGFEDFSTSSEW